MVVFVGDCASCVAFDAEACQRNADAHNLTLLFLTTGPPNVTKSFQKGALSKRIVVRDPEGQIVKNLNAAWQPRCYLFSTDWHLRWLQKDRQGYYDPFADKYFVNALQEITHDL